jgi:hypothetical protein
METENKLSLLQSTYAAALAEAANTFQQLGALESVVAAKAQRQALAAPVMNAQLGVAAVPDVFTVLSGVFGCANWTVEYTADGYTALATSCKLWALSKKMGGANVCHGWCLNPMRAMAQAVDETVQDFAVESTLMDADCCRVVIRTR